MTAGHRTAPRNKIELPFFIFNHKIHFEVVGIWNTFIGFATLCLVDLPKRVAKLIYYGHCSTRDVSAGLEPEARRIYVVWRSLDEYESSDVILSHIYIYGVKGGANWMNPSYELAFYEFPNSIRFRVFLFVMNDICKLNHIAFVSEKSEA